jgi:hypothetical protein
VCQLISTSARRWLTDVQSYSRTWPILGKDIQKSRKNGWRLQRSISKSFAECFKPEARQVSPTTCQLFYSYRPFPFTGTWTPEEERQLAGIMEELQSKGEGEDTDAVWTEVVRRMGGTRSRAQVRTKWCASNTSSWRLLNAMDRQDSLRKNIKTDGRRRWLPIDSYILIHKSVYSPCR